MKKCCDCGDLEWDRKFPRGRSRCHKCQAAKQRAYNDANRDRIRAINSASNKRHPDRVLARTIKWAKANPEKRKAIQKKADAKFYSKRRAKLLASPELQAKARAAVKSWHGRNKDRWAVYYHRRRFRLAAGRNDYTQEQWDACKDYFEHRCGYCLRQLPLEMEHMQPLSRGGENTDENVIPACEACNLRKSSRTILQWLLTRAA